MIIFELITVFKTYFRQQLEYDDDPNLAKKLGVEAGETTKFDVFVTEKCEGNSTTYKKVDTNTYSKSFTSVISQLIEGLDSLRQANIVHNDLKPGNILYKTTYVDEDELAVQIKISDFGSVGKLVGTPGWTAPTFMSDKSRCFESDMYSMGLVILYVLCESDDLFYAIRDNFIVGDKLSTKWLANFRRFPEIQLILKMMNVDRPLTILACQREWNSISDYARIISKERLDKIGVPEEYQVIQSHDTAETKSGM